ncbi:GntR family transcriptional regulator [Galbibacter pacificus]|uniref:GntR family transcriptional regulator n=1 Tax=Galbibacter pacificus TaxID=2996052 RepID=A0ABT6FN46_9FLAO|nr:GntR family transcriptional regulator [Galbibacter pacificus]MDG3581206.1 GntR family transcriptional regulator [Galbibacter pacificus]MDG3584684.1 GntR family transcriptional regulator [Galbibacter pacificus]
MDKKLNISILEESRVPKYTQIVNSIIGNISSGKLEMGERIPSINELSAEYYLSRDTVEKAYNILKEKKIITSVKGKGYYVSRTQLIAKKNILFLINKPSSYKMRIFKSFTNAIGADVHVDLSIYHCDETLFLNLIEKHKNSYDHYIIMPHFKNDSLKHLSYTDEITAAINEIPKHKLVLMDNNKLQISGTIREIYQDFENDIFDALTKGFEKLKRYKKLFLIYPRKVIYPYPLRILRGFVKFCGTHEFDYEILDEVYQDMEIKPLDAYIVIEENDLVNLVKMIRDQGFIMGRSVGVISYNDTPLKELLDITVVSTDFKAMGEKAAEMIMNNSYEKIKNPFHFIERISV